ncbi:hypothetical protein M3484_21845 [Pseudomonas sp. GX19020]|uniref:hypothetical protein n=1 Tax=Pseudomonas sp. GX19020 TaxID=2942277 RepID=UPI0020186C70|nr:hypothetical protein [Pseudomonas sp. GX19020]MCL4069205.1 hypothetical protein [Pseudomonas sp. GX19020]
MAKLYVGGKQTRPDSGYSYRVEGPKGMVGLASLGSRKDIRNAAHAARGRGGQTGHNRAQVLYYLAENLSVRSAWSGWSARQPCRFWALFRWRSMTMSMDSGTSAPEKGLRQSKSLLPAI